MLDIHITMSDTMRYDTLGDWYETDDGKSHIVVVKMNDPKHALLIAVHELIEAVLCSDRGITQQAVDTFDFHYDRDGEPGNDVLAPYHAEHQFATVVEMLLARELNVDYQQFIDETNGIRVEVQHAMDNV